MSTRGARHLTLLLCLSLLRIPMAGAADKVDVKAFVNDSCIIADEPFFLPDPPPGAAADPGRAKFLPLLGIVIGKLAELFINHEIQASAARLKTNGARRDTRYAVTREMNLYRVDFQPSPTLTINAKLGCMTIVAASFKPSDTHCKADYAPKQLAADSMNLPQDEWRTSRQDDSVENQLRRADVCVAGHARAVYEARFEFSNDGTAYRLKDAGYRIESLLTTDDRKAVRNTIYTLKISNPGATDQQETLSSAWVNLGKLNAGARSPGNGGDAAAWLRVPPLSVEARRVYDEKTRVHQDVMGEIEALQRAMTRDERILTGLDQRLTQAAQDTSEGLKQERNRIAVQRQMHGAELDARRAEYQDLPRAPLEFMPVTIEVAVTETESEKKAQVALAEILGSNSDMVGSAVGNAATGLISRGVAASDLKLDGADEGTGTRRLELARAQYYDALIATQDPARGHDPSPSADLEAAKREYNDARKLSGLEPIK